MKRTLILLAILACLGGIYFFVPQNEQDAKVEKILDERAFAIEDELIERVVITEKNGNVSTLTRDKNDIWYINGKRIARNQKYLIKETLTDVRVNSIPPKGAYKQIMRTIGDIGILVRVFGKNDEMLRSYYVGGVPQGERGTYYLMEGYSQPYLMEMPGMEGSTRGRFIKQPDQWLDRGMFRYPQKDIKKITVEYPKSKNDSYVLTKKGNSYELDPFFSFTPKIDKKLNKNTIDSYLESFYVGFYTEAYINDHPKKDSIIAKVMPMCNMTIENDAGELKKLSLYPVNEILGEKGKAVGPDVDALIERYFVNVDEGERFMLTQQRLAKKFLWGYDWFYK